MRHTATGLIIVLAVVIAACGGTGAADDTDPGTTAAGSTTPRYTPGDDDPPPTTAADGSSITIAGFSFGDPITVPLGTEVTVTNEDGASHTWTSRDGLWDSGSLAGGGSFSFTFTEAGTFPFFCAFHGSMSGSLTVTG